MDGLTMSVFVSYARTDQAFVVPLAGALRDRSVAIWIDQWSIEPAQDWDAAIDAALAACEVLLIVLSPAAVESKEVRGELRTAIDDDKRVVPVLYCECRIPRQLRTTQYVDFTDRDPTDGAALDQLVGALAVGATEPALGGDALDLAPEILDHMRGKPDVAWTIARLESTFRHNHPRYRFRSGELAAAVESLMMEGYLVTKRDGTIGVTERSRARWRRSRLRRAGRNEREEARLAAKYLDSLDEDDE